MAASLAFGRRVRDCAAFPFAGQERTQRRGVLQTVATGPVVKRNVDDIISVAIALAVTVVFIGQTVESWTSPFRLGKFQLEYENPLTALFPHSHQQSIAFNAARK